MSDEKISLAHVVRIEADQNRFVQEVDRKLGIAKELEEAQKAIASYQPQKPYGSVTEGKDPGRDYLHNLNPKIW